MSSRRPQVLTAGPLRSEWLYGFTDDERRGVVDTLLAEVGPQVFQLYLWDRPAGGRDFPLVYLTVAVDGPVGAAHFYDHDTPADSDAAAVTNGNVAGAGRLNLKLGRAGHGGGAVVLSAVWAINSSSATPRSPKRGRNALSYRRH